MPFVSFVALLPTFLILADPAPTYIRVELTFALDYEIEEEPILAAELWACYVPECSWDQIYSPDVWRGTHSVTCSGGVCNGEATYSLYFIPFDSRYYRLRIKHPDRLRVSNTFYIDTLHPGELTIVVREYDLVVTPDYLIHPFAQWCFFLPLLGITIATEIAVANYIARRRQICKIPGRVAIANLITLPIVWFLLPSLGLSAALTILLSESLAVALEALFIRFTRSGIDGRSSLILSLSTNGASFALGLVIFGILSIL
jgi:hypothetical protein